MSLMYEALGWGLILAALAAELGMAWNIWKIIQTVIDFPISIEPLERHAVHACGFVLLGLLAHQYLLRSLEHFTH